mgnify:CR=1 FL=1
MYEGVYSLTHIIIIIKYFLTVHPTFIDNSLYIVTWFSFFQIFGQIYPFVPEFISDWIVSKVTGHYTKDLLTAVMETKPEKVTKQE